MATGKPKRLRFSRRPLVRWARASWEPAARYCTLHKSLEDAKRAFRDTMRSHYHVPPGARIYLGTYPDNLRFIGTTI